MAEFKVTVPDAAVGLLVRQMAAELGVAVPAAPAAMQALAEQWTLLRLWDLYVAADLEQTRAARAAVLEANRFAPTRPAGGATPARAAAETGAHAADPFAAVRLPDGVAKRERIEPPRPPAELDAGS